MIFTIIDGVSAAIYLWASLYFGWTFFKNRTKYHLALSIVLIILFTIALLDFLLPGPSLATRWFTSLGIAKPIRIFLYIVFILALCIFLYYPYIRWYFYQRKMNNPDLLDKDFQKVLKHHQQDTGMHCRYANFLWYQRNEYDKAEEYYRKAIELDPKSADTLGNNALFLEEIRQDYDQAEQLYLKAIELEPKNAWNIRGYARFLWRIRKDHEKANEYFIKAIEAEPKNAKSLNVFANFLYDTGKDFNKAEELFKQAIELDGKNADYFSSYANFLLYVRKEYDHAEDFIKKAIKLNPKDTGILGGYALFLMDTRKDYNRAEKYYKRAVASGTKSANDLGNYAKLLIVRGNLEKAKTMIERAFEYNKEDKNLSLEIEMWFYRYAIFYAEFPESDKAIEDLLAEGVKSPGWYLKDVLYLAQKRGHPDYNKLSRYESMITSGGDKA
jgi:protein O-mannosyl-transferase